MSSISSLASSMASQLFSKLDTSGQGYLSKTDLESAFSKIGSTSSSSSSSTSEADELFSKLDSDSDGKVTQQEFTDTLTKLADQLTSAALQSGGGMPGMGMGGGMSGMGGGMSPPPPPENDSGFTKDELQSQLDEIGSSDSKRSSLISKIVQNFDAADTDGDGKVSFKEAQAYDQSTSTTSTSSSATSSTSSSSGTSSTSSSTTSDSSGIAAANQLDLKLMQRIMELMRTYSVSADSTTQSSTLSVTA